MKVCSAACAAASRALERWRERCTPDDEVWKVLAYLKTLAAPAASDAPAGNANGERIYRAQCQRHRTNGRGGVSALIRRASVRRGHRAGP